MKTASIPHILRNSVFVTALFAWFATRALSQQPSVDISAPKPVTEQPSVDTSAPKPVTEQRRPAVLPGGADVHGEIYRAMYEGFFSYLSKPDTAAKFAKFQKTYYDALIREGFTKDEALKIVTATGIPALTGR